MRQAFTFALPLTLITPDHQRFTSFGFTFPNVGVGNDLIEFKPQYSGSTVSREA